MTARYMLADLARISRYNADSSRGMLIDFDEAGDVAAVAVVAHLYASVVFPRKVSSTSSRAWRSLTPTSTRRIITASISAA
jgi:hypothetical protein